MGLGRRGRAGICAWVPAQVWCLFAATVALWVGSSTWAAPLDPMSSIFNATAAVNSGKGDFSTVATDITISTGGTPKITTFVPGTGTVVLAQGMVFDQGPSMQNGVVDWSRQLAVFVFPGDVDTTGLFGPGSSVTGDRPIVLLSRQDIVVTESIDLNGGEGKISSVDAVAGAGGMSGGGRGGYTTTDITDELALGAGPGRGALAVSPPILDVQGAGGAFGGASGSHPFSTEAGVPYGNLLERLQAGTGGAGFSGICCTVGSGGGGGGAIEIGATGTVTIQSDVTADGGHGGDGTNAFRGNPQRGGGGSGGGVLIHGGSVVVDGAISAAGGSSTPSSGFSAGGGGGGRVAVLGLDIDYVFGDGLPIDVNVDGGTNPSDNADGMAGTVTLGAKHLLVPAGELAVFDSATAVVSTGPVTQDNPQIELLMESVETLTVQATGQVQLGADQVLFAGTEVIVEANGVFDTAGFDQSLSSLVGEGIVSLAAGSTLTLGQGNVNNSFDGLISGAGDLRKVGSGTMTLSGTIDLDGSLKLEGGVTVLPEGMPVPGGRIEISGDGVLLTSGVVQRDVTGDGQIDAAGSLVLGSLSSTTAVDFQGTVNVGSNQLILFDADMADLGAETNLSAGGLIDAINGAQIGPGETINATAGVSIDAVFVNNGQVNGPTAAGQFLVFEKPVSGSGNYSGNIMFLRGFSPGSSPAVVAVEGDASLGLTGDLVIELGGTVAGEGYDRVDVSGELSAAGTLRVELIEGFAPKLGDVFDVLSFASLSGGFENVVLPSLDHGLRLDASELSTAGRLTVVPEPAATGMLIVGAGLFFAGRRR